VTIFDGTRAITDNVYSSPGRRPRSASRPGSDVNFGSPNVRSDIDELSIQGMRVRSSTASRLSRQSSDDSVDCDASMDDTTKALIDAETAAALARLIVSDIVLVSYGTLQDEIAYTGSDKRRDGSGLRAPKRYHAPNSVLLSCHYHRIILDEAQVCEAL
jgi:hypothetical protein